MGCPKIHQERYPRKGSCQAFPRNEIRQTGLHRKTRLKLKDAIERDANTIPSCPFGGINFHFVTTVTNCHILFCDSVL